MSKENNYIKEKQKKAKLEHNQYVQDKISQVLDNPMEKQLSFRNSKRLRYYDYIIIILACLFAIGISFLISIYLLKNISRTEWVTAAFTVFSIIGGLVTSWLKNNYVANYYNDKRKRYQTTLSDEEGTMRRIAKIFLITGAILLIVSIVFIFVL